MMDEQEIEAIRSREQAATPGPWQATPNLTGVPNGVDISLDPCVIAIVHSDAEPANLAADTAFIAAAREDVPALLAEIEAMRAEWAADSARWEAERDERRAEVKALRIELDEAERANRRA
jgi:hypothetical protein